jgi:hypothetical protein
MPFDDPDPSTLFGQEINSQADVAKARAKLFHDSLGGGLDRKRAEFSLSILDEISQHLAQHGPHQTADPGFEGGIHILSNGTSQGTLVCGSDGNPMGVIDRMEIVVDAKTNRVTAVLTMPVSSLDIHAEVED